MLKYLVNYLATLVVCLGIDLIWLKLAAARLYRPVLGDIMLDKPRLSAAIVFYLLYTAGVVTFVGAAALRNGNWTHAALYGALFGLFCYATYDLTNQATLRNWSLQLTIIDMIWGATLTALSATAAYFITRAVVPAP